MASGGIELAGLVKRYRDAVAVDGVSLAIAEGQFVALVGASGSGKTTLLKTINRLVEPDAGRVDVAGDDVSALDAPILRRRIGYVFQGIGLFPHLTVAENIAVVPSLLGWSKPEIAARVTELLALVDLPAALATRRPAELSGGQQQRVGVARALAARPGVMLMDEPFGALDPVTRDTLGAAYRGLHDRLGLTTVMVTHDMQEALLLADRIVVMKAGRVIADASPGELMAGNPDPEVERLISTPRRQAERLRVLMGQGG
jgi:osmoprotectant transport system ATP-binding protein